MSVFKVYGSKTTVSSIGPDVYCVKHLVDSLQLDNPSCYVLLNGKLVQGCYPLCPDNTYHIIPRLNGGKGGFGSMLRAIGAQIEKTTSREACRDLSGRRMRDINNEKKLKEWLGKEAEREKEREEKRQERLAKRLAQHQHKFDDPVYDEQRAKVQEGLEDALQTGLKRALDKGNQSKTCASEPSKKSRKDNVGSRNEWLGMDLDSDDLDSDSDNEANPGPLSPHTEASSSSSSETTSHSQPPSATTVCTDNIDKGGLTDNELKSAEESETTKFEEVAKESESGSKDDVKPLLSLLPPPSSGDSDSNVLIKQEPTDPSVPIDLDKFGSSSELMACGLDRLKAALMSLGLKCGGTLEERAQRLFLVKGLSQDQIDPSLFAKSKGKGKKTK